ncbi:hypothetical protein DPMN_068881 [Dreissena polymorpha]|uniref:Uncharacterized protein n=1 Tax=Dreissena polymorpha TaxID=45954 RepID=A0A9D3YY03_DREPO|nr:hypothetical protein DPMN_068881 [Dreissena polymorpha]
MINDVFGDRFLFRNEAYRQAQRNDGLHFICKQCEERNWPEITDTDADEDERALTNTDQQSMGNSIYENASLMIMNFIKCA